jgi:mono/diheme cytochrome c family protein
MRYVYLVTFFLVVLTVGALGFRGAISTKPPLEVFPDMDRMPKYQPQGASAFFADGRADRPLPVGVVARGDLRADAHLATGKNASGAWAQGFPADVAVDNVLMERGRDRYMIYCAPCHGQLGDGRGIVASYGWGAVANLHADAIRNQPDGELYNTVANGKNTMYGYADKLDLKDRWAVVAYVRALQRAHTGKVSDVPPSHKAELGIQ